MRRTILTFVQGYLPGFLYGGPVRSVANIVAQLGDEFDFCIVASDRDHLSDTPYKGINADEWNAVGKAKVYYASPRRRSLLSFTRLIRDTPHDLLYLNSAFDPAFSVRPLIARRMHWIDPRPTVVASRGEFSRGALSIKTWKKAPFLALASISDLYRGVVWQASSESERDEILRVLGQNASPIVAVAPDLPSPALDEREPNSPYEKGKRLQLVFLSRVDRMKNLDFALRILSNVTTDVDFNIFGPRNDPAYWSECEKLIAGLPPNISAKYCGTAQPSDVPLIIGKHDLFLLPTLGENFGHAIWEALSSGTPVVISDRTPWIADQAGACTTIPLDDLSAYIAVIERVARMKPAEFRAMRRAARDLAIKFASETGLLERTRDLFRDALNRDHASGAAQRTVSSLAK